MKKIEREEYKRIMLKILENFDKICRKNDIKYSLIGGSLIGAIRHNGIIPWDDDIDVILEIDEYYKLIDILKNSNDQNYKLLYYGNGNNYFLPFLKLVDTRTYLIEEQMLEPIDDYGIFIDIFCYTNTSNNLKERKKHIKKIKFYNMLLSRKAYNKNDSIKRNILRFCKNLLSKIIGYDRIMRSHTKCIQKYYNDDNSKYVISNWPIYSLNKEIQIKNNIQEYIDVKFENLDIMVFKNYDAILKNTFGNYMELPPIEQRKAHGLIAYWKKDYYEK